MKVYLVLGGYSYEGDKVLKIFDSKDKAEKWAEEHLTDKYAERYEKEYYDLITIEERGVE